MNMEKNNITRKEMKIALEEAFKEQKRRKAGNKLGYISIIIGIIFLIFIPILFIFGLILGIIGLLIALYNKNYFGLVLNFIGLILNGGFLVFIV